MVASIWPVSLSTFTEQAPNLLITADCSPRLPFYLMQLMSSCTRYLLDQQWEKNKDSEWWWDSQWWPRVTIMSPTFVTILATTGRAATSVWQFLNTGKFFLCPDDRLQRHSSHPRRLTIQLLPLTVVSAGSNTTFIRCNGRQNKTGSGHSSLRSAVWSTSLQKHTFVDGEQLPDWANLISGFLTSQDPWLVLISLGMTSTHQYTF